MVKILPSTFKMVDQAFSVVDDRRISVALIRHFSVPVTIVADMIVGIVHLIFLGVRQELTQEFFWDISHEHFFVYPFQQLIYFLFSSIGALKNQNYFDGYCLGQWAVMNLSNETYRGPPQIFSHMIASYDQPQYFEGITLSDRDRHHLNQLVIHTSRFQDYKRKMKMEEENIITNAEFVYQVFYPERPLSIHGLDQIFQKKISGVDCGIKDALTEAKFALEAFFALPRLVQLRLINQ